MFDDLIAQDVWRLALAAAVGGAAIGLLPRSHIRSLLIWAWAMVPLAVVTAALSFTEAGQLGSSLSFVGLFLLVSLLPWAGLALLPYNLVRRLREIRSGVDYRNVR
jgi:hypothetical protein